jgi:hypothetical protein
VSRRRARDRWTGAGDGTAHAERERGAAEIITS